MHDDTIVAISSAVGSSARMIVRVSGPAVRSIHASFTDSRPFTGGAAHRDHLNFRGMKVPAWVYQFESPRSVTGQDLVEYHIPGNPLLAKMLLGEIVRLGARQAEAGEFSARGYFSGKIDLTEAEGIAAAIAAQSERELRAARQLMSGELAHRLRPVMDSLADTLALIEAGIDFTDQDISFIAMDQVQQRVIEAKQSLQTLLQTSARLEKLSHEPQVVLAGRPNAGKSTLLNELAGKERAIVSPVAGTTRDVLWAHVHLKRGTIRLIDVAGLDPFDPLARYPGRGLGEGLQAADIEQAMQLQARRAIDEADILLLVRDSTDPLPAMNLGREPDLIVLTKIDLLESAPIDPIAVSAKTGAGIPELRERLDAFAFVTTPAEASLALNARHIALIEDASQSLERAHTLIPAGLELLAMELRETLDLLGGVLGSITPDDVLGRVFSRFCIGK